jgi:hypothetical protein
MEKSILSHLVHNEQYGRKVLPFLKTEYFQDQSDKTLFEMIHEYATKYNAFPTKEALFIELSNAKGLKEDVADEIGQTIQNLEIDPTTQLDWLVDKTEKFCQDKAIYNAVHTAIKALGGDTKTSIASVPDLLRDALGVTFNSHIGHDFIEDWSDRFDS